MKARQIGTARMFDGRPVLIVALPTGAIVPLIARNAVAQVPPKKKRAS